MPIPPQSEWHMRQSIDYVMSVNRAILDLASKYREDFLYRIYKMGRNSIDRGSKDNWTIQPDWIDEAKAQVAKDAEAAGRGAAAGGRGGGGGRGGADPKYYKGMLTPGQVPPSRKHVQAAVEPREKGLVFGGQSINHGIEFTLHDFRQVMQC